MAAAVLAGLLQLVLALALASTSAADDPCTATWDGGAHSVRWQDATNWSGDRVPRAADVACIPAGASVRQELGGTVAGLGGEGTLTIHSGVLNVTGPSSIGRLVVEGGFATLDGDMSVDTLTQSAGLLGGSGTVSAGSLTWSGGSEEGVGSTFVRDAASLVAGTHSLAGDRDLEIGQDATLGWDAGNFEIRDSARLVNSGLVDIRGDQDLTGAGGGEIDNLAGATLRKSAGSAETFVANPVRNEGTVEVGTGTLNVHSGVESTGTMHVADAATLRLDGGGEARLLEDSHTATEGSGRVLFAGIAAVAGDYTARTVIDATSAVVAFHGSVTVPRLEMRRGVLQGEGTIVTQDLDWTGGMMLGAGATELVAGGPGLVVSGPARHDLQQRRLSIAPGATARVAEQSIVLGDGARLENSGRIELADGTRLDQCCGGASPLVHNLAGAVLTSDGPGRSSLTPPFTNDGTVAASAGTLAFSSVTNLAGGTLTGGTWLVSARLELPSQVLRNAARLTLDGAGAVVWDSLGRAGGLRALDANRPGGELTVDNGASVPVSGDLGNAGTLRIGRDASVGAAGRFEQTAGTTTLLSSGSRLTSSTAPARVSGGVLSGVGTVAGGLVNAGEVRPGLSPGTLTVSGDYEQTGAGTLEIEIGGTAQPARDLLDISGAARLAGTLRVKTLPPFLPAPLDEFDVLHHASVTGAFDQVEGRDVDATHHYSPPDYEPAATWLRSAPTITVAISDVTVDEGAGQAVLEVRISAPSRNRTGAYVRTVDRSAVAPGDYTSFEGPVIIEPGETVGRLSIPIADDGVDEPDETFDVQLSETFEGDRTATVTIADNDEPKPDPAPVPDPDPTPDPTPVPDPDPTPVPTPDPAPVPDPDPTPIPDPDPKPVPDPTPLPTPDPTPVPDPDPTPLPTPDPTPVPDPDPTPKPDPAAEPDPAHTEERRADPPPALPVPADPAPPATPAPLPKPPKPCVDRLAPRSSFRPTRHPIQVTRGGIHFRGIAWDRGCGKLDRVTVAIARRVGGGTGLCRYLQATGRLGAVVSCRRPTYVRARGKASWSFRRSGAFPPGTWTARIRAVDRAGNAEKKVLKPNPLSRNFVTFKIR